jgi:hypothetical protein
MARFARAVAIAAMVCVAAIAGTGAHAAATEASELSCAPAKVHPGENMTCTIRGRDATHEATRADPTDFLVSVHAEGTVIVSSVRATVDETVVAFTVSSDHGTFLSVEALARNGLPVRGAGFQALVYAVPPTELGTLSCDAPESGLVLRSTTTCTVGANGAGGVPAAVAPRDVVFSEDHGDGSFEFVSGDGNFVFRYTAPASPSSRYAGFALRVALTDGVSASRNVTIPVAYPEAQPTTRSRLVCSDSDFSQCSVNAANAAGLVRFDQGAFTVDFERQSTVQDGAWTPSTAMAAEWSAALASQLQSFGNLRVDQRIRTDVMRVRVHVRVRATGEEISGSPHDFTSGVAPKAGDITMRRCSRSYLVAGRTATCYMSVGNGASAATRFVAAEVSEGAGEIGELFVVRGNESEGAVLIGAQDPNLLLMAFNYTAPEDIEERLDVALVATVAGDAVVRAPVRLVVFPSALEEGIEDDRNKRPPVIALGLCFFGSAYLVGVFTFMRRNQRLSRVKANRRSREVAKQEAAATVEREERQRRKAARPVADENGVGATAAEIELQVAVRGIEPHERSFHDENLGSGEQMPKAD